MTPSEAYETGRARDAGHDNMQARLMLRLRDNPIAWDGDEKPRDVDILAEQPIEVSAGRIVAFADIAERATFEGGKNAWRIYEIKPSIGSAGALVRQCRVLEQLLSGRAAIVIPVVMGNDPKLGDFKILWDDRIILMSDDGKFSGWVPGNG
ncbi:MAG TPA: hypothetical protein VFG62_19430 [Rhodopila sp.]|nr:hypothetical protein [Rhodopila sp.]